MASRTFAGYANIPNRRSQAVKKKLSRPIMAALAAISLPLYADPIPSQEILETEVKNAGDRTIVLQRVTPKELPPTPASVQAETTIAAPVQSGESPQSSFLFVSAEVYQDGKTQLRWESEGEAFEAWSNVNFAHFNGSATATASGSPVSVLIAASKAEAAPETPANFPQTAASFVLTKGDATKTASVQPIQVLHDLYKIQGTQLAAAYQARETARLAKEAVELANPPQKKDIVIKYWRVESGNSETPTETK